MSTPRPLPMTFRLTRCPRCDYALEGLPAKHTCPECGFAYELGMFLVHGWCLAGFPPSRRTLLRIGLPLVFLAGLSPLFGFGWSWATAGQIFMGALAVFSGLYWWAHHNEVNADHPAMRYLIARDGIHTRNGRLLPWQSYSQLVLLQDGGDAWRVHIYPKMWDYLLFTPSVNLTFRGSFSDAEALRKELQSRINAARDAASRASV